MVLRMFNVNISGWGDPVTPVKYGPGEMPPRYSPHSLSSVNCCFER